MTNIFSLLLTPNVSCKMYFVPYTLVTLPSYTYSSEVTRKQAQNMTFFSFSPPHEIRAFFQGYFVSKYPLSLTTTVELVCQTFMPFVQPPPTLLYYNFCQGPSTAPVCSFTKRIPFLLPCRDLGEKLRYARSTSENFLNG